MTVDLRRRLRGLVPPALPVGLAIAVGLFLTVPVASTLAAQSEKPAAESKKKEPDGFGKAKFGMSPQAVERLYLSIRKLDKENLGASVVYSPLVARQLLTDQSIPGLKKPVRVELRYWKERLWVIIVYWGENGWDDVKAHLVSQLGEPRASVADPFWRGEKVTVTTSVAGRWYALAEKTLSKEAQEAYMEDMRKTEELRRQRLMQQSQPAAQAATAGGPTPATKAP